MSRARRAAAHALAPLAVLLFAVVSGCGGDLSTVQCTSNANCPSRLCRQGICVEEDDAQTDADDEDVVDANPFDAADAARDTAADTDDDTADVADTSPPDAGVDTDAADTDASAPDAGVDTGTDTAVDADASDAADGGPTDADAFDAPDLADVPIDPDLVAPTGVEASDGTDPALVTVVWDAVEGADGYRVYRDDIAVADVIDTVWDDLDATLGVAGEVSGVSASTDQAMAVTVSWSTAPTGAPGATHAYAVASLRGDGVSERSVSDDGFTGASPAARYDVEAGTDVVPATGTSYLDTGASPPTVTATGVEATWDGSAVQLRALGAAGVDGAARTYRVRAITAVGGVGPWSAAVAGRRAPGPLSYAWERSAADADGGYAALTTTATGAAVDAEGPPPGAGRFYRVTVRANGAAPVTTAGTRAVRDADPVLPAPTGVRASDGTSSAAVTIVWDAVPGATSYDVYRDDALIAGTVTATSYDDTTAEPGGAPAAPGELSASTDLLDRVSLTWTDAARGAAGPSSRYAVAARDAAGPGIRSAGDDGFRAAPSVTGYEVSVDEGAWQRTGTPASWDDTDAPSGTVEGGAANATDGTAPRVELTVTGAAASPGAVRSYRVRAVASAGPPGASAVPVSGRRAVGDITYQWQRTSTDSSTGTWTNLAGATSATYNDTTLPADGTARWYRCSIDAPGAGASATSTPDRGFRSAPLRALGETCSGDAMCESGTCGNGRCAPSGFSYIEPGTFTMGSPLTELGRTTSEVQHTVTLTRPFFMQQTEVTQGQWRALIGNNPSFRPGCGDTCPVESVNWYEALSYANALSEAEGLAACYALSGCTGAAGADLQCAAVAVTAPGGNPLTCEGYRLPTESEWEYAARAGTTTATWLGDIQLPFRCDPQPNLEPIAWYCENAGVTTHPVATALPNPWGLFDMLGNVDEWSWDWSGTYPGTTTDPLGGAPSVYRSTRGGNFSSAAQYARAAFRGSAEPGVGYSSQGIRLVRTWGG